MTRLALIASLTLAAACGGKAQPAPAGPSPRTAGDAPAPEGGARSCQPGHFMASGACVPECGSDADCTDGARCEPIRHVEEDGTTGAVAGSTCQ